VAHRVSAGVLLLPSGRAALRVAAAELAGVCWTMKAIPVGEEECREDCSQMKQRLRS